MAVAVRRSPPRVGRDGFRHNGLEKSAELQLHFGRRRRLARVAAAEDDIFHLVATQALGALFAHDPRDRVGDVALAAAVGADDGGHAVIERELRPVRERFEAVDFETLQTHGTHPARLNTPRSAERLARRTALQVRTVPEARALQASDNDNLDWLGDNQTSDRCDRPFVFPTGKRPRGRKSVVSVTRLNIAATANRSPIGSGRLPYRGLVRLRPACLAQLRELLGLAEHC